MSDTPEPPSVVQARESVELFQKRLTVYVTGVLFFIFSIVGAAVADAPKSALFATLALYVVWALGGVFAMRATKQKDHQHVIKEWESRELREEFAKFDVAVQSTDDPRVAAAAAMADRIRALDSSPRETDDMVTRLEARLRSLVTDQNAAAAAVKALEAAGAGSTGTGRLLEASERLDEEISRIVEGMSELYASLLEAGSRAQNAEDLADVMAWLEAEAEIARAQEREAIRPAGGHRSTNAELAQTASKPRPQTAKE
ncbi:MAG: hypothetical protein KDA24_07715 [Deltaproteobacteria bacterium]|nr:hypothetical protein [Deltaproteobacteria bacterium]